MAQLFLCSRISQRTLTSWKNLKRCQSLTKAATDQSKDKASETVALLWALELILLSIYITSQNQSEIVAICLLIICGLVVTYLCATDIIHCSTMLSSLYSMKMKWWLPQLSAVVELKNFQLLQVLSCLHTLFHPAFTFPSLFLPSDPTLKQTPSPTYVPPFTPTLAPTNNPCANVLHHVRRVMGLAMVMDINPRTPGVRIDHCIPTGTVIQTTYTVWPVRVHLCEQWA